MLGWSVDELLSMPILDLVHPDDLEAARESLIALADGNSTVRFTQAHAHNNRGYRVIHWAVNPEPSSGNIFAIGRDVTEERNRKKCWRRASRN